MAKMKVGDTVRQGDVLLVRIDEKEITGEHRVVPREGGRVVLALGESSMHAHVFRDPGVCMLRSEGIGDAVVTVKALCDLITEGGEIAPGRPRHDPVSVPPGAYKLVVQREWAGEEVRTVAD